MRRSACMPGGVRACDRRARQERDIRSGGVAASATGKDLAPRVAARWGVARPDVTDFGVEVAPVTVTRPVYAGKALLKLKITGAPALISLRPSVFTPVERQRRGRRDRGGRRLAGRVVVKQIKARKQARSMCRSAHHRVRGSGAQGAGELQGVGRAGRGLRGTRGGGRVARRRGRRLAPSREQVDRPARRSVPPLYVAVGISGAIQHLAGMRTSKVIVAITRTKTPRSSRWRTTESWGICSRSFPNSPKK